MGRKERRVEVVGGKRRGAGGAGALALVAELGDGIASVVEDRKSVV